MSEHITLRLIINAIDQILPNPCGSHTQVGKSFDGMLEREPWIFTIGECPDYVFLQMTYTNFMLTRCYTRQRYVCSEEKSGIETHIGKYPPILISECILKLSIYL